MLDLLVASSVVYLSASTKQPAYLPYDLATASPRELAARYATAAQLWFELDGDERGGSSGHNSRLCWALSEALLRHGAAGQEQLVGLLSHPDPAVRFKACSPCLEFAQPRAYATMKALAREPLVLRPGSFNPRSELDFFSKPVRYEHDPEPPEARPEGTGTKPTSGPPLSRAEVSALAARHGLGAYDGKIQALLRPALDLGWCPAADEAIAVGASKLGGLPDLPRGMAWPRRAGVPLPFLAQLRLADVAQPAWTHDLQATGHLAFFWDADRQPGITGFVIEPTTDGQVRYWGPEVALQRASRPVDLVPGLVMKAAMVRTWPHWTLPTYGLPGEDLEALSDFAYDLDRRKPTEGHGHQLLGYCHPSQDPFEELLPDGGRGWVLLAEFSPQQGTPGLVGRRRRGHVLDPRHGPGRAPIRSGAGALAQFLRRPN